MSERTAWRLCLVAGFATLLLGVWLQSLLPTTACTPINDGTPPLLVYQLARTSADINALFGASDSLCAQLLAREMDSGNRIDLMLFIPVYATFLLGFLLALAPRDHDSRAAALMAGALVVAVAGDVVETIAQLRITEALPGSDSLLLTLALGARAKFVGLVVFQAVAGIYWLRRPSWAERSAGLLTLAGCLITLGGLTGLLARPLVAVGPAVGWLTVVLVAMVQVSSPVLRTPR